MKRPINPLTLCLLSFILVTLFGCSDRVKEGHNLPDEYAHLTPIDAATLRSTINQSIVYVQVNDATQQGVYAGSGIIIENGIIVTNAHVVLQKGGKARGPYIEVTLPSNQKTKAVLVGYSHRQDVAVLKVTPNFGTPHQGYCPSLQENQPLVAYGHPEKGPSALAGNVTDPRRSTTFHYVDGTPAAPAYIYLSTLPVVDRFSGGPMVDIFTGNICGMTVGYIQRQHPQTGKRQKLAVAISMDDVMEEVIKIIADQRKTDPSFAQL